MISQYLELHNYKIIFSQAHYFQSNNSLSDFHALITELYKLSASHYLPIKNSFAEFNIRSAFAPRLDSLAHIIPWRIDITSSDLQQSEFAHFEFLT